MANIKFSKEGTGGFNGGSNFGNNYCSDEHSGCINVLVDGEMVATLYYERGEGWSYMGPAKDKDGENVDRFVGNLRKAKAYAKEQLSS